MTGSVLDWELTDTGVERIKGGGGVGLGIFVAFNFSKDTVL